MFKDATISEINDVMDQAWSAFHVYRKCSLKQRAAFMKTIAVELDAAGDELIQTAMRETNLPEARMRNERARTIFQLNYCWVDEIWICPKTILAVSSIRFA